MNNLRSNKKRVLLAILAIFSILSLLFIFSQFSKNKKGTPTPQNLNQATFNSITPGISTKGDVVKALGKPLNTDPDLLEFKSSSPNRNNKVEIDQDKVSLVKEIITLKDPQRAGDIIKTYGVAPKILYGGYATVGFYLFVYPENGIAYIGHPESGLLLEIWYFPPTNLADFKANYANNYSEKYQGMGPESFN